MFTKYMTAGLLGSALLASAAFAQSAAPTTTAPVAAVTASDSSYNGNWRTSKVVGLNVYNDGNESLGSINDLLTDKSGNIKAVVIGVGGFLGVGEQLVAVPFDKIKFVNEPVVNTTAATATGGMNKSATTTTTGAATATTTGSATTATAAKPNPWYPDHAVLSATKDQLKAMSAFKYSTN
ncbi:MAG: PRC-barrel domain-containing protein [Tardiphaga sp.]|uniref:PRC-barrel domain-containing protein n=1 Tax=Tardiphaga sp. TaxID=1926292 RepID=UPI0019C3560F|nr:PRC-barrel domain-containing protein [Tardiphaga sp.]MBC7585001.1 PRC-barrel domain-containing protein [Tardiphaga sp.]